MIYYLKRSSAREMLQQALSLPGYILSLATDNVIATLVIVAVISIAASALQSMFTQVPPPAVYEPERCGDITAEALRRYNGVDPYLPLYFAVKGEIFDVSKGRDFYGPGAGYAMFAGREVSRALALMSLDPDDCCAELADLTPRQLETLEEWISKFREKYHSVGRVVPELRLSVTELKQSSTDERILLSIRGIIFDVTKGRDFYGPDGMYPFAGHECARALAKLSFDEADFTADLQGLEKVELDALREWEGRFHSKYNVIGKIVDEVSRQVLKY